MLRLVLFIFLVSLHLCNSQIPASPFGKPKDICPQANNRNYFVDGFKGTPFILSPFQDDYVDPPIARPSLKECRPDGHCIFSYTVNVFDAELSPFARVVLACVNRKTKFLTYNGSVPGPTVRTPTGHETLVRFTNLMGELLPVNFSPCNGSRRGRPFSVHNHGSASRPTFDGWAEDETCRGETKEYVYPNNRPATQWYHDHALHITAENAYLGLAGYYLVSSKIKDGGCGEPWNMEHIEEKNWIIQDKVLDFACQLFIDEGGIHENNLYGDINMMSGIPWPRVALQAKWYRFRLLNAAASRPYLLKIKNSALADVAPSICFVIASDGGFRPTPVAYPSAGLLMGVAERYEIVCDFRKLNGQTLYFWNDRDEEVMKDVPYFCYSHLLARFQIAPTVNASAPVFQPNVGAPGALITINQVLNASDIALATQMANNGKFDRRMQFGRGGGQWVINGETWDTDKFAATNIGHNTWELWFFQSGGGWFHPVHLHHVDLFILLRDRDGGIQPYERLTPKDVFYLGPAQKIYAIARFGPHKGDYMFHCHNLIHEDNDMMRAYRIIDSEKGLTAGTAQPFILNPFVRVVYSNPKFDNPLLNVTAPRPTDEMPPLNAAYLRNMLLNVRPYRIFYPDAADKAQFGNFTNPWQSTWCRV